jgi:hypothetical protein
MFMFDKKQLLIGAAIIVVLELVTTVVRASGL